jgi:hypothetical protein
MYMQMKLSIDTLTDFMSDGWSHFDLVPRNIIVTHTQGKRSLVFVDLYSAEFYEPDELDDGLRFCRQQLYLDICESLGDDEQIQSWAERNLQSKIVHPRLFRRLQSSL